MANSHRGEVTLTFTGKTYTLRPTFHILASLEQRLGLTLPQLLCRVEDKGLLASEMLLIMAIATQHDGSAKFDTAAAMHLPAEDKSLQKILPPIARFLLGAMGGESSLDFPKLMAQAYQRFGVSIKDFWEMSAVELKTLLRGESAQINSPNPAEMQQSELHALIARFPDKNNNNHAA